MESKYDTDSENDERSSSKYSTSYREGDISGRDVSGRDTNSSSSGRNTNDSDRSSHRDISAVFKSKVNIKMNNSSRRLDTIVSDNDCDTIGAQLEAQRLKYVEDKRSDGDGDDERRVGNQRLIDCFNELEDLGLNEIMPSFIDLTPLTSSGKGEPLSPTESPSPNLTKIHALRNTLHNSLKAIILISLPSFIALVINSALPGEYNLEQSAFHSDYVDAIEISLEKALDELGWGLDDFLEEVKIVLKGKMKTRDSTNNEEDDENETLTKKEYKSASEFMEIIDSLQKFENFAEGMRGVGWHYVNKQKEQDLLNRVDGISIGDRRDEGGGGDDGRERGR